MKRRNLLLATGSLLIAPLVRAQSTARVPRVGVLDPLPAAATATSIASLRDGLRREGLAEGKDYQLEYRSADGHFDRLPALAAELAALPVQVLVARNTPGMMAARAATTRIPIVMADVGDPVGLGFVASLARPGGNVTGLSNATLELLHKRLELLRELLSGLKQVAILSNARDQNTPVQLADLSRAASVFGIEARNFDAGAESRLGTALDAVAQWRPQAMLPLVQPLYRVFVPRLIAWAATQRMPVVFARDGDAERGGLMAYAADLTDHYQRVAKYVARLLAGGDPATMAVERPTRFLLSVNLKAARVQSIVVPQPILVRADRVIE
ncbi:MAG: ABC transporter substrate-binding protein [Betaproteobacteria bacterium]